MDPNTVEQLPKAGMHGALKFFLMMLAGVFIACIVTPCLLGVFSAATKNWTLKDQYAAAINSFIVSSIVFLVLSGVVGPWLKRWGISGFLFGVSMTMGSAILIAEFMKMFDSPK